MLTYMLGKQKGLLLIAVALLLAGCGGMPKNAEEFRQATRSAPFKFLKVEETFEVARPFPDVSSTLRKKSDECLAVTAEWTRNSSLLAKAINPRPPTVNTYKPTFIASPKKAELHLQLREGDVIVIGGAPADGGYRVVLDATPVARNRTRIDIYASSIDDNLIVKAMRGWVRGDNLGCPDLK